MHVLLESFYIGELVKAGSDGICKATTLLYELVVVKEDIFTGFAETDNTCRYPFYNVLAGTYRVAVGAVGYDNTKWSDPFFVIENMLIPDIIFQIYDIQKGDIIEDRVISLTDVVLALQVFMCLHTDGITMEADVNGDGKIGMEEVVYILQEIAGLRD